MKEKEIKNVNVAEEIKVDMTVNEPEETEETKKEKAFKIAKSVGAGLWRGVKVTCTGVGAIVLGALAVGVAMGSKKEDENSSEYSGGELDMSDTTNTSATNESSEETTNEGFDL